MFIFLDDTYNVNNDIRSIVSHIHTTTQDVNIYIYSFVLQYTYIQVIKHIVDILSFVIFKMHDNDLIQMFRIQCNIYMSFHARLYI